MDELLLRGERVKLVGLETHVAVEEMEKYESITLNCRQGDPTESIFFRIQDENDGHEVGLAGLTDINSMTGTACAWLGMGDHTRPDHGYEMDAMMLVLRYAYEQLRVYRVNLDLVSSDEKRISFFEDCGFRYEGAQREVVSVGGSRLDVIHMGALRVEWTGPST